MGRKKNSFLLIPLLILAVSCKTTDQSVQTVQRPVQTQPQTVTNQPAAQRPQTVSQAQHDLTLEEVQQFINNLNRSITNRNFNQWRAALSQEYLDEISSPANLRQISDQPAMKTRGIVLKTAEDYFTHVVVPSRANSRVDDIEFFGNNRVKAFTITTNRNGQEQRLRLYDLEKIGNTWKIIN